MKNIRDTRFNMIVFTAMFLSILLDSLLHIIYSGAYPIYFSIFSLFFLISYIGMLQSDRGYLTVNQYIFIFLLFKLYIFIISLLDYNSALYYFRFTTSDAAHYHIPSALILHSVSDCVNSLFSSSLNFNGRLTHVILYFEMQLLSLIDINPSSSYNIAIISFLFNTMLNIKTILVIYKTAKIYFNDLQLARKAVFFIAFNPFILYYSNLVQKEGLLFLAIAYILLYLVQKQNRYFYISTIIFLFERPYMLMLSILLIFFLSKSSRIYKLLVVVLLFIVIEMFLGIDRALSMHHAYLVNLRATTHSLIPFDNGFVDMLKILFGPVFVRPFFSNSINDNVFYVLYYLMVPFYTYIVFIAFKYNDGVKKVILLSLSFVYFVAPFHSTLKLTILTIFFILFVDHMKIIKTKKGVKIEILSKN